VLPEKGEACELPVIENENLLDWFPAFGGMAVRAAYTFGEGPVGVGFNSLG